LEATKYEYFIDGFLLKHFGVWPTTMDKNNLFEEQKIFIVNLMGIIPDKENWSLQTEYRKKLEEINKITKIKLTQTDIDLVKLQNRNIELIKKERLFEEKRKKIRELKEKYHIFEEKENKEKDIYKDFVKDQEPKKDQNGKLWDILQGKGIIK